MISFPAAFYIHTHTHTYKLVKLMVSKVTNGHVIVIGPFKQIDRSRTPYAHDNDDGD